MNWKRKLERLLRKSKKRKLKAFQEGVNVSDIVSKLMRELQQFGRVEEYNTQIDLYLDECIYYRIDKKNHKAYVRYENGEIEEINPDDAFNEVQEAIVYSKIQDKYEKIYHKIREIASQYGQIIQETGLMHWDQYTDTEHSRISVKTPDGEVIKFDMRFDNGISNDDAVENINGERWNVFYGKVFINIE